MIAVAQKLDQVDEYYFSQKLEQIAQMRSRGFSVINLGIGSPDLMPPHEAILAAEAEIKKESAHGYSSYRSSPELRVAISTWYEKNYQVKLDPNSEILPLLGSKEGIFYLTMASLNPGDQVLCPNPGYLAYASAAKLAGAQVVFYDLQESNGWLPDLEVLDKVNLSRCKLMWINYPHMPTGASCDFEFYERVVQFAAKKNILICNDNPYGLVLNERPPVSILSAGRGYENVLELNSLSKTFNMPGWRVGMFLGSRKWVDAVVKVKSNVDSGMFAPIQKGAIAALSVNHEWHLARNEIYRQRRKIVFSIFDCLGFKYKKDSVGLFVWSKAPDGIRDVSQFCDELLEKKHIFITPGYIFGSQGARYVRASLCANEALLTEAFERIAKDHR